MFEVYLNCRDCNCSDFVESFDTLAGAKKFIMEQPIRVRVDLFVTDEFTEEEVWHYDESEIDHNELCWELGLYSDDCSCSECSHSHECSGSDVDDEDDDE